MKRISETDQLFIKSRILIAKPPHTILKMMLFPHICSSLTFSFYNICKKTADVRIAPYQLSYVSSIQLSYWRIAISLWIGCPCAENFSSYSVMTFPLLSVGSL